MEIERLIVDAQNHGRWFFAKPSEVMYTPTSFDKKEAMNIINKMKSLND